MTETDESPNRHTAPRIAIAAVGTLLIAIAAVGVLRVESQPSAKDDKDKTAPKGKMKPIIAVHGGYTSELRQDPKTLKAKQGSIAWVIAQAEDYLLGRIDGKWHTAVETAYYAVRRLEENPLFNAGLGARFQQDGQIRRTASIMGRTPQGKYVSASIEGVQGITHPIEEVLKLHQEIARQPKHDQIGCSNRHLAGREATQVLLKRGAIEEYVTTQARLDEIKKFAREQGEMTARPKSTGTVGCVVMDCDGHFAAATSTGGTANNVPGRVGDSGTSDGNFASGLGAASMTGDGEAIRNIAAASGLVQALKYVGFERACHNKFQEAFEHHATAAAIFIGKGKGDEEVQVRFTDANAAIVAGYTKGDGKVLIFSNDMSQYYDDKDKGKEANAAGLGSEYAGFAKKELIGLQRRTMLVELTSKKRDELLKSLQTIEAKNPSIDFIPPGGPVGKFVPKGVDVKAEMKKACSEGKAEAEKGGRTP
jgi:isoaspartyl peptidase/L-asparaginase-like protein (Ntn-hydrolase superfamily)